MFVNSDPSNVLSYNTAKLTRTIASQALVQGDTAAPTSMTCVLESASSDSGKRQNNASVVINVSL